MSKLITPYLSEVVARRIYLIREQRVMLDVDLAKLYGVLTKNLNKAVKRNLRRFPADFMFKLTPKESEFLRFQIGTSKKGRGGLRYAPTVFTEQGVAMLSSVLASRRAVHVNIQIMRAFVNIRKAEGSHKDLLRKIEQMEQKYDVQFQVVFRALKALLSERRKDQHGKRFET